MRDEERERETISQQSFLYLWAHSSDGQVEWANGTEGRPGVVGVRGISTILSFCSPHHSLQAPSFVFFFCSFPLLATLNHFLTYFCVHMYPHPFILPIPLACLGLSLITHSTLSLTNNPFPSFIPSLFLHHSTTFSLLCLQLFQHLPSPTSSGSVYKRFSVTPAPSS